MPAYCKTLVALRSRSLTILLPDHLWLWPKLFSQQRRQQLIYLNFELFIFNLIGSDFGIL